MPDGIGAHDRSGPIEASQLKVDFGPDPIDQERTDIMGHGLQHRQRFFKTALPRRVYAHSEAGHRVVGVEIDRLRHVVTSLVQQAHMRIHQRQLMVGLVSDGIEFERFSERADRLRVWKTLGLGPQDETAGEVRLGQVWIQIQCLCQRDVGVLAEAPAFIS